MLQPDLTNYFAEHSAEWVVLNDPLCYHLVDFPGHSVLEVFAKPKMALFPSNTGKILIGQITCPVCGKVYKEASKVLQREANRKYRGKDGDSIPA